MITELQKQAVQKIFELAANEFGFVFHSPFVLSDNLSVFGYIENYGSKNGAVICLTYPPDFPTNQEVLDLCKQMERFVSFLNIESLLGEYSSSYFGEMLQDWGKY